MRLPVSFSPSTRRVVASLSVLAGCIAMAAPAVAQQRASYPGEGRPSGMRYLTWPGKADHPRAAAPVTLSAPAPRDRPSPRGPILYMPIQPPVGPVGTRYSARTSPGPTPASAWVSSGGAPQPAYNPVPPPAYGAPYGTRAALLPEPPRGYPPALPLDAAPVRTTRPAEVATYADPRYEARPVASARTAAPAFVPAPPPVRSMATAPVPAPPPVRSMAPAPVPAPPPVRSMAPAPVPAPPPVRSMAPAPVPAPPPVRSMAPAPVPAPPPVRAAAPAPVPAPPPVRSAAPAPVPAPPPVRSMAAPPVPAPPPPRPQPAPVVERSPSVAADTGPAAPGAAAVDPFAPRPDAPIFRLMNRGNPPAEAPPRADTAAPAPAAAPAPRQPAPAQSAPAQSAPPASPPADIDRTPRRYSVHRANGQSPDRVPLPDPVLLDSAPVDLAEPPATPTVVRNVNGRLTAISPASEDPALP